MDLDWTLVEYRPGRYARVALDGSFLGMAAEAEVRAWFAQFSESARKRTQAAEELPPRDLSEDREPEPEANWSQPLIWGRQPDFRKASTGVSEAAPSATGPDHAPPEPSASEPAEQEAKPQADWSKPVIWGPPGAEAGAQEAEQGPAPDAHAPDPADSDQAAAVEAGEGAVTPTAPDRSEAFPKVEIPSAGDREPQSTPPDDEAVSAAPEDATARAGAPEPDVDLPLPAGAGVEEDGLAIEASGEGLDKEAPILEPAPEETPGAAAEVSQLAFAIPLEERAVAGDQEPSPGPEAAPVPLPGTSAVVAAPGPESQAEGVDGEAVLLNGVAEADAALREPEPIPEEAEPPEREELPPAAEAAEQDPLEPPLEGGIEEEELDLVLLSPGTAAPLGSAAKVGLPEMEPDDSEAAPAEMASDDADLDAEAADAEGQWLWVDPRYDSGYSPSTFDLTAFLDRAMRLFQSKRWTRGRKPGRVAARPEGPDQDGSEGDGLKSAAEALGLEVVYDARVPTGTYWLGLATEEQGQR